MIHPSAIVDASAIIAPDAHIGPWTFIGAEVEIDEGTTVGSHVVIKGPTRIGKHNQIFQFASIGEEPQDKKFHGERVYLEVGDHNVIREYVTLNRGTGVGGGTTRIGSHNLFMACSHVAHDCHVHDHVILANYAGLAGHVTIKNYASIGPYTVVHQRCTVGEHAFIAPSTVVRKDVLPFLLIEGDHTHGINVVGLRRCNFSSAAVSLIRQAYKIVFRRGLTVTKALQELEKLLPDCQEIQWLIDALVHSERGILR